jgi:hypothetical protein
MNWSNSAVGDAVGDPDVERRGQRIADSGDGIQFVAELPHAAVVATAGEAKPSVGPRMCRETVRRQLQAVGDGMEFRDRRRAADQRFGEPADRGRDAAARVPLSAVGRRDLFRGEGVVGLVEVQQIIHSCFGILGDGAAIVAPQASRSARAAPSIPGLSRVIT